jgi:DNA invertase Pin-like site-specific DNA recombinase
MIRAGIYARISDDRVGDAAGVKRQEADCRALAERKHWDVVELYVDNDASAYSGKARPEYRRMLDDIKAGHLDAVIVWHLDRLTRRPVELETFFEACDAAGIRNLATCTGDVDLATHDGQFMARILGAVARKESDDKSRRTSRKHLELAQAGRAVGGRRPFGYDDDKVTIRPLEAELIRETAERVLVGDTLRSLCKEWNDSGRVGPLGGRWTPTAMRRILLSPRVIGKRAYKGTIVADGEWPPILDPATQERVRAVLEARATPNPQLRARTYLLTGFLRCGRCGVRLAGRPNIQQERRNRTYVCANDPAKGGCGGLRIVAEPLEALVGRRVRARLASPAFARARATASRDIDDTDLVGLIAADEVALEQWAIDHVDGTVTRGQFLAATQRLEARVAAYRRRLARAQAVEILAPYRDRPLGADEWDALPFDRKRALIGELVDTITIAPATPGLGRFDESRVTVTWRR